MGKLDILTRKRTSKMVIVPTKNLYLYLQSNATLMCRFKIACGVGVNKCLAQSYAFTSTILYLTNHIVPKKM